MIYSEDIATHFLCHAMIVGSFFTDDIVHGAKAVEVDDHVTLKRERYNKFDVSAVAVYNLNGIKLGYLAKGQNAAVANVMDSGMAECFGIIRIVNKKRSSVGMMADIFFTCNDDDFYKLRYIILRS